jgi:hypothetical protein
MNEAHRRAVDLARFYFRHIAEQAGMSWDGDNDVEIELMVSRVVDAAAAMLRGQLDDALERVRALEADTPQARQLQLEADQAAADLAESGYDPGEDW